MVESATMATPAAFPNLGQNDGDRASGVAAGHP
jgi:hypothetical protein